MRKAKNKIEKDRPLTMIGLDKARKDLSHLVQEANKSNARFLLSERGKPQAVVLGIDDFLKNVLKKNRISVVAQIQLEVKEKGLDKISMKEIDKEVKAVRKKKASPSD